MNNLFLLFHSPKPRSHVRILIYRKWPITNTTETYNAITERSALLTITITITNYFSNKHLLTVTYSVTYNYVAKCNLDLQYIAHF